MVNGMQSFKHDCLHTDRRYWLVCGFVQLVLVYTKSSWDTSPRASTKSEDNGLLGYWSTVAKHWMQMWTHRMLPRHLISQIRLKVRPGRGWQMYCTHNIFTCGNFRSDVADSTCILASAASVYCLHSCNVWTLSSRLCKRELKARSFCSSCPTRTVNDSELKPTSLRQSI